MWGDWKIIHTLNLNDKVYNVLKKKVYSWHEKYSLKWYVDEMKIMVDWILFFLQILSMVDSFGFPWDE